MTTTTARTLRLIALAVGPFATLAALNTFAADAMGADAPMAVLIVALLWSPAFFSVPALLLQHERDALLPTGSGVGASLARGSRLVPALLGAGSTVRTETAVSLGSWMAFCAVHAAAIGGVVISLVA